MREVVLKQIDASLRQDQQGDSGMWALVENLYRDYCFARLQEFRKRALSS
jgi:hypothetical protein